jgi:transketolase
MTNHNEFANAIRFLAVDAVEAANSGHPGMPMGMADVATVLFKDFMRFDPKNPTWPNRDRFVLSAGHGSALLYALGYLTGYPEMTIEQLKNFRQMKSLTPGHPEKHVSAGIEMTTGPLGQGLATAVGMALGEQMMQARFGSELIDHKTYVIASDGDMQEGVTHEACSIAGHLKLKNMIVLYDSNDIQIDGSTALSFTEDVGARFMAYGWQVDTIDGHDPEQITNALYQAQSADRPVLILCKTQIGFGSPNKAKTHGVHGSPLGKEEMAATRAHLKWSHEPFVVPEEILNAWRMIGKKGAALSSVWEKNKTTDLTDFLNEKFVEDLDDIILKLKQDFLEKKPEQATRKSSGDTLEKMVPFIENLIGGSADLTPSNNTRTKEMKDIAPNDFTGRYIRYGVREFGMACIMNGLSLYGGFIPYGGTFLQFSDYARPALRLAALMKQRVIHVMTHDSIGLGEDGPTHQPVEHFAALRAIPNLQFLRPCDAIETAECWQMAINTKTAPTVLALSRQNLPTLRLEADAKNLSALGGYILRADDKAKITFVATGSEVSLAVAVHEALKAKNIASQVVSMPSREIFQKQPLSYQAAILGSGKRVVIEAGIRQGWEGIMGQDGLFFGVETFGESAPYQEIYAHFGLTVENILTQLA